MRRNVRWDEPGRIELETRARDFGDFEVRAVHRVEGPADQRDSTRGHPPLPEPRRARAYAPPPLRATSPRAAPEHHRRSLLKSEIAGFLFPSDDRAVARAWMDHRARPFYWRLRFVACRRKGVGSLFHH